METQRFAKASFALLLTLIGIAGVPEVAFAGDNNPAPTLTVQIYNYSQAPPAVLARAEHEAGGILRAAGLQVIWLECPAKPLANENPGPCQKSPEAGDLRLRILPAPIQNQFPDSVFGFAVHPVLASVYYDFALRRAKQDDAEFEIPLVLGWVIAHELGHLLLGSNGHSSKGIMQPRWEPNQVRQLMMGTLLFTPEQSKRMSVEAEARIAQLRNNLSSTSAATQH